MFGGSGSVSAIKSFSFSNSFLSILNRYTHFGLIPDELIEIIFELAGYTKPDYVESPLFYDLKYISKKYVVDNSKSLIDNVRLSFYDWDTSKLEVIKDYNTDIEEMSSFVNLILIIHNFPYEIFQWCKNLNPKRLRDIWSYVRSMCDENGFDDPQLLLKRIISSVHRECFLLYTHHQWDADWNTDWSEVPDEMLQWMIDHYIDEVREEYGDNYLIDCEEYLQSHNIPTEGNGLCMFYNIQSLATGYHMRVKPGHQIFYDREDEAEHGDCVEGFMEEIQHSNISLNNGGRYSYKHIMRHTAKNDIPYRIRKLMAMSWASKRLFKKKLIDYMTYKRKVRIMTIERYLATGIDTNFTYVNKNAKWLRDIRCFKDTHLGLRKRFDGYKFMKQCPNITDGIRLLSLREKYLKVEKDKSKEDEALFYLMKMSLLCNPMIKPDYDRQIQSMCKFNYMDNSKSKYTFNNYPYYDKRGKLRAYQNVECSRKELYEWISFMGSEEDLDIRINPGYNTSRITLMLGVKMVYVAKNIGCINNTFKDLDNIQRLWKKYN